MTNDTVDKIELPEWNLTEHDKTAKSGTFHNTKTHEEVIVQVGVIYCGIRKPALQRRLYKFFGN